MAAKPLKCRLGLSVKQTNQESGSELCGHFQTLIVSVLKI